VEVTSQVLQGALDAFMAVVLQQGVPIGGGARRDVEAPLECHQAIDKGPRSHVLIGGYLCFYCNQRWVLVIGLPEAVDEVEMWSKDGKDHGFLCVVVGQHVCHGVGAARLVHDREIEAEQLAHPMVLQNVCQALIE
jgi:hypothetical protein